MLSKTGLKKITIYVRPDQYLKLRAEALEVCMKEQGGRQDVSQILRDMIDIFHEAREAYPKPKAKKASKK